MNGQPDGAKYRSDERSYAPSIAPRGLPPVLRRHRDIALMLRSLLLILAVVCALSSSAQDTKPLRDSLAAAAERLAYYPDSVDLRLRKAGWNVRLEQWDYAREEYDYILKRHPYNIAALFYRAYVNERQRRYSFARLDYESVLTLVPGHFEASLGLALLNQKDRHFTEALDQINRLVNQYPDSAVAYAARAGIEQERGMLELAEYDYSAAIERDACNKDYILCRAAVRLDIGRKREARDDLDRLVQLGTPRAALTEYYERCK